MEVQPIIILGAARSGTNILRDVLCTIDDVGTWPCDEINYIWRHGNARHPNDEFTPDMARPPVVRYIRKAFEKEARRLGTSSIVEKTCANTLRPAFVDRVVPESKYVVIVRNGLDVVLSAKERWTSNLSLKYAMKKARYVPATDIPYYAAKQTFNRIRRLTSGEGRLRFWGPRFEGMDEALREMTLDEVCALQWRRCVEATDDFLGQIEPDRFVRIRYEEFARHPIEELRRIASFLGLELTERQEEIASSRVSPKSIGRGVRGLDPEVRKDLEELIEPTMARLGYDQK